MTGSLLRGHLRDASSPSTLLVLLLTISFLLASYWSSSTERFALRSHEGQLLARIRADAASLAVLVNATRRLDQRLRDAKRRVVRLTQDNEEYKTTVNRLKKASLHLRKQRFKMFQRQEKMRRELMKHLKGNKTTKVQYGESVYFFEESSSLDVL